MILREVASPHTPESLARGLSKRPGLVLLQSLPHNSAQGRFSFVAVHPFLTFRSFGSRCEVRRPSGVASEVVFGNPWNVLQSIISRCEILGQLDLPLPMGGCFGFWGYDLRRFVEPQLEARLPRHPELPDCHLGFYGSLVAFDHKLEKTIVLCTGLLPDGSKSIRLARKQLAFWQALLESDRSEPGLDLCGLTGTNAALGEMPSSMTREQFLSAVGLAREYIRRGHVYQVNLSHRFASSLDASAWELYEVLSGISPAPFSAFLDCGEFQLVSASPELFLRMSGDAVTTRPIKGTRPRSHDRLKDAQLALDLLASAKERAELVMITDLLRNDLGKMCDFGSVHVPEIIRHEEYSHVRHLVSTVEGRLRSGTTHVAALASCFPGGSVTGAPKIRSMEIIEELETTARGPYTGSLGFLGFNRESQLSIVIRTVVVCSRMAYYGTGAGIVEGSDPQAEYDETLAKARAFVEGLGLLRRAPLKQLSHRSHAG